MLPIEHVVELSPLAVWHHCPLPLYFRTSDFRDDLDSIWYGMPICKNRQTSL
ncbi:hypothetical protein Psal160_01308 [Piscirickettsia salmonis]|nr:hypothetical protein Psal160_01308 [Piscirickettsia salmonis]